MRCDSLPLDFLNRLEYRRSASAVTDPDMTSQLIPVEPFDFIIFGGTGDLSERKLLPALYYRQRPVLGADAHHRRVAQQAERRRIPRLRAPGDRRARERRGRRRGGARTLRRRGSATCRSTPSPETGFDRLREGDRRQPAIRAFYLAVAPSLFGEISEQAERAWADHAEFAHRRGEADRPRASPRPAR